MEEPSGQVVGRRNLPLGLEAGLDEPLDAFQHNFLGPAGSMGLEGIRRLDSLREDGGPAFVDYPIVAEQLLHPALDLFVPEMEQVAGVIKKEPVWFFRAGQAARPGFFLEEAKL